MNETGDWNLTQEAFDDYFGGQDGVYTLMWYWEFRNATNIYTTCWDANITQSMTTTTTPLAPETNTNTDTDTNTDDTNSNTEGTDTDTETQTVPETSIIDAHAAAATTTEARIIWETIYTVRIPICYSGANLNESLLMSAFNSLIIENNLEDSIEFTLISAFENDLGTRFNATIETNELTNELEDIVTDWAYNGDICSKIKNYFNGIGSCTTCGGASVTSMLVSIEIDNSDDTSNENEIESNNDNNSFNKYSFEIMIALSVVSLLLLILIGLVIYWIKMAKNKNNKHKNKNGIKGNEAEFGMATNIAAFGGTDQKQAITIATDDNDDESTRNGTNRNNNINNINNGTRSMGARTNARGTRHVRPPPRPPKRY